MNIVLWLMAIQGFIGAFDTLYYHEWRARLPARGKAAASELKLHAARDFLYAILFATLPFLAWQGLWAAALVAVVIAEIVFTLWDFVVEILARRELGDVYAGERVTHAVMGIIYGAIVGYLTPNVWRWWHAPTGLVWQSGSAPPLLQQTLLILGIGVFLSGLRDLYASLALPMGNWPWKVA